MVYLWSERLQAILCQDWQVQEFNGSRDSTSTRGTVHEARGNSQGPSSSTVIHTNEQVHGLIATDMTTGQLNSLQSKCVIIADGGYEEHGPAVTSA